MSEKASCPGCNAYTSGVFRALRDGEEMPCCGLSHGAAVEIATIQCTKADEAVKKLAEAAIKRAETAEHELAKLRGWMQRVRSAVAQEPYDLMEEFCRG